MGQDNPFISVVIPLHVKGRRFSRALEAVLQLDYPAYEVFVVVDDPSDVTLPVDQRVQLLVTGRHGTGPAEKRDVALPHTRGEIVAFLDDDAYPDHDWLRNAVKYFSDSSVAIVGGPAMTPPEDPFWQQVSGAVLESVWGSGPFVCRFAPRPPRVVLEHPGCNLFIRKNLLYGVAGFDSTFYGGEDTLVCFKIARRYKRKILCVPDAIVYHHRRALWGPYLRQIANFGIHRGYFFKRYPETSCYVVYCLPLIIVTGFVVILCSLAWFPLLDKWLIGITGGVVAAMIFTERWRKRRSWGVTLWFPIGVALTHATYGLAFLRGLCTLDLKR